MYNIFATREKRRIEHIPKKVIREKAHLLQPPDNVLSLSLESIKDTNRERFIRPPQEWGRGELMHPIRKWLWLIFGILAVSIGGYMLFFTPHTREVVSLSVFLPKLLALIFMGFAVAFFPNTWKYKYIFAILLIFAFLIPYENALSWGWYGTLPDEAFEEVFIPEFGQDRHYFINELWNAFYVMLLPSIIFGVSLAFRIGGGSIEKTLKVVFSGLLVYFSCLNIFVFQTIFHLRWGFPYSETAGWVYHVSYFIGRDPLMIELVYWFIAFMVGVVLINIAPLGRWGEKIGEKLGI